MQAQEERPPYVVFETRAVEDRSASITNGSYASKDQIFALITPQGTRDCVEKVAESWLIDITRASEDGRFPSTWVEAFKHKFKLYKEGQEIPEEGTAILNWPPLSPAQSKAVLDANIRTVEDLAIANEPTLGLIGMGARALKEKAINWLATSNNVGKVAEEVTALKLKNADLETQVKNQADMITKLKAEIKTQKD